MTEKGITLCANFILYHLVQVATKLAKKSNMASRKRKAGGWSNIVSKKRTNYTNDTKAMDRDTISYDKVNVYGLVLSRKYTEKTNQEVTVLVGGVNPGCIGSMATKTCTLKYDDDDTPYLSITPEYSYQTLNTTFKGRETFLRDKFPILPEDEFKIVPFKVYKLYCKAKRVPQDDFTIVKMVNFSVTCGVSEPWGTLGAVPGETTSDELLEKSFFVRVSAMEEIASPRGVDLIRLLYQCDAITRELPQYSEVKDDLVTRVSASISFSQGQTAEGANIMNSLWNSHPWQERFMPPYPDVRIFQFGSHPYFIGEYYPIHKSGCDKNGKQFILSPLTDASMVHEDDVMKFKTRTSKLDETPVHGWRFIAHVFQATVTEGSREKQEKKITEEDLESFDEMTLKFSMYKEECLKIGMPLNIDDHGMIISSYYKYFPFALSCKIDAKNTINRPENTNEKTAFSYIVDNAIGPVKEFWETIGIPISKELATEMLKDSKPGTLPSLESFPSEDANGVACISDTALSFATNFVKTFYREERSLFVVICKSSSNGIVSPELYTTLRDIDVWDEEDVKSGDVVIRNLFGFEEEEEEEKKSESEEEKRDEEGESEDEDDDEEDDEASKLQAYKERLSSSHPKAHNILNEMDFFEPKRWKTMKESLKTPYIYSTKYVPEMSSDKKRILAGFVEI